MTQKEFLERYPDEVELREMANEFAKEITIRSYKDGSSRDVVRSTTKPEKEIISNIIFAAFISYRYRHNGSLESICDMAEFSMHQFIPEANAYMTVYLPIVNTIDVD